MTVASAVDSRAKEYAISCHGQATVTMTTGATKTTNVNIFLNRFYDGAAADATAETCFQYVFSRVEKVTYLDSNYGSIWGTCSAPPQSSSPTEIDCFKSYARKRSLTPPITANDCPCPSRTIQSKTDKTTRFKSRLATQSFVH